MPPVKRTNSKPKLVGGVNKDPNVRVKVKSTALALATKKETTVLKTRISKLNTKGMKSIIGDSAEDIQQLLEVGDNDSAVSLIYKRILQSLVDLLPFAEHAVRKSKGARGVYQINSLISSIRELMTDIQSAQDRGMLGEALVEKIIRPSFLDIGMEIMKEYAAVADDSKALMDKESHTKFLSLLRSSRGRMGDKITGEYKQVQEQTRNYLQR